MTTFHRSTIKMNQMLVSEIKTFFRESKEEEKDKNNIENVGNTSNFEKKAAQSIRHRNIVFIIWIHIFFSYRFYLNGKHCTVRLRRKKSFKLHKI